MEVIGVIKCFYDLFMISCESLTRILYLVAVIRAFKCIFHDSVDSFDKDLSPLVENMRFKLSL